MNRGVFMSFFVFVFGQTMLFFVGKAIPYKCHLDLPVLGSDQCNVVKTPFIQGNAPSSLRAGLRNGFRSLNQEFLDTSFDAILSDNTASAKALIDHGINNLRSYHSCLDDFCKNIGRTCSNNDGIKFREYFSEVEWCNATASKLFLLAQASTEYAVIQNIHRKKRSLITEAWYRMGFQLNEYIHRPMIYLINELNKSENGITRLIQNPITQ